MDKEKRNVLLQQLTSLLLFVVIIGLLGFVSVRFKLEADWTAGNRNTLTEASQRQLASMPDPIGFTAFVTPSADMRKAIEGQVAKYQRFKRDIRLEFIDPSTAPQKVRELGISAAGEVVLEYQGRSENLRVLSEQAVTTALQRLAYSGEQWVLFLEGHGERRIDGDGPEALSTFAQVLRDKGLKVRGLNLAREGVIPDNTSALVIASPRGNLLEGEQKLVTDYVARGGNLLWLADPDDAPGIEPLAEALGIQWQEGYAVFPDYQLMGTGHPGIFLAFEYPASPLTRDLFDLSLFPLVRSIGWDAGQADWVVQPFLKSQPNAWLETGTIDGGAVDFDPASGDIGGPLEFGIHLTRSVAPEPAGDAADGEKPEPIQQRVVLVGDGDFIANAYLGELANQQLGLNIIQWLASRDAQLNIDIPKAPDTHLFLPTWALVLVAAGFVLVLPLGLIGFGVGRWLVRRRR